jgi:hypothetical protein
MSTGTITVRGRERIAASRALTGVLLAIAVGACSNGPATTSQPTLGATAGASPTTLVVATPLTTGAATSAPPSAAPSAPASIAGTWHGTWTSEKYAGLTGGFTLDFQQSGSNLSGTIEITGTPCITSATITGALTGNQITFGAVKGAETVTYTGTWAGATMDGTWVVSHPSGGQCAVDSGSWQAAR